MVVAILLVTIKLLYPGAIASFSIVMPLPKIIEVHSGQTRRFFAFGASMLWLLLIMFITLNYVVQLTQQTTKTEALTPED